MEVQTGITTIKIKTWNEIREENIIKNKTWRLQLDGILQEIKNDTRTSRNRTLSITHLEDAIMRLGMDLKELGTDNPYPESKNPSNTTVEPTADGLKL